MCIWKQMAEMESHSFPLSVQVASYCDFLISFGIPHPTIHPLSQKHGNLPGFLPFPHLPHGTNQLSIPAPVYLTDPSSLTHIHCHHCSCTFFRFSSLSGSSFPTCNHLPHHYLQSDVVLPLPQRIHGYCLPSGESSDKGIRTYGSPLSVQPVSCLSSHPDTDYLSLPSYLQFCMSPSFFLQSLLFSLHVCLTVSSSLLTWLCDPFKTSLLWECFPNPLSSPGLIQVSLSVYSVCNSSQGIWPVCIIIVYLLLPPCLIWYIKPVAIQNKCSLTNWMCRWGSPSIKKEDYSRYSGRSRILDPAGTSWSCCQGNNSERDKQAYCVARLPWLLALLKESQMLNLAPEKGVTGA